jgi:hypothetical protein
MQPRVDRAGHHVDHQTDRERLVAENGVELLAIALPPGARVKAHELLLLHKLASLRW